MGTGKTLKQLPRKRPALAATFEPIKGDPPYLMHERHDSPDVERHTVVADMTAYLGAQYRPELLRRSLAASLPKRDFHP